MKKSIKLFIRKFVRVILAKTIRSNYPNIPIDSFINHPLKINGKKNIIIGHNVIIGYHAWLEANPLTGNHMVNLEIGDGCCIGNFNEIYATKSIVIENNVLTADRVYISDNLHDYSNPNMPIVKQSIKQLGTVRIGEGSWLGIGVAIIGANIGKHCIIGANAVVTHDIPDYSVAVGIPAKVIKHYNHITNKWEKSIDREEMNN